MPKTAKGIDKQDSEVNKQEPPTHEQISVRAYALWEEGGRQDGSPALDWENAEKELSTS